MMNLALKLGEPDIVTYENKNGTTISVITPVYGPADGLL